MKIPTLEEMDDAIEGLLELFQADDDLSKANPYKDAQGKFTTKAKAVAPKGKNKSVARKSKQEYERAFAKTLSLPYEVKTGVDNYSVVGFRKINASLRKSGGKNIIRDTERMDLAIAKGGIITKSDIVVFRGAPMRVSTLDTMLGKGTVKFGKYGDLEVGKPSQKGFVDHGFVSTSLDVVRAERHSSKPTAGAAKGGIRPVSVIFQITVKKGSRVVAGTFMGKQEQEVILNRGAQFKIVSVEKVGNYGNQIIVELEAVSP